MNSFQTKVNSLEINSQKDNSMNRPYNSAFTPIIIPNSFNNYIPFNNQNYGKNIPAQIIPQNSKINNNSINTNLYHKIFDDKEVPNKELNNNKKIIKKNKFKISHFEYHKTKNDEDDKKDKKDKISSNRLKHKRKNKPDDIRKKIKARFHKSIKNIINENLRKAGSKKLFTFLPQVFITSISRQTNRYVLNLSLREILQKNFVNDLDDKKYKNREIDLAKYKKNLSVLEYLDNNPEICKNSGFDIISKMKYCDLLEEYFKSKEFQRAIFKLKEENEDEEYIKEYIIKSKNYVKFFMENDKLKIKEEESKNFEDEEKNKIKDE